MKIKRYLSIFFMIVFCFLMQTTVLSHFKLTNIIPNLLVIMTSASGFMFGRRYGMFAGVICGGLMDLIYGDVVGVCIFIFVLIGFFNGLANKYYFKDDLSTFQLTGQIFHLDFPLEMTVIRLKQQYKMHHIIATRRIWERIRISCILF